MMPFFQTYFLLVTSLLVALTSSGYSEKTKVKTHRGSILSSEGEIIAHSEKGVRRYLYGKEMAHITGFVSTRKNKGKETTVEGRLGIEMRSDELLSMGKDVNLTIDAQIQLHAYSLLEKKGLAGAIVVQDPNTGKILALASYPSFDANLFIPKLSQADYSRYIQIPTRPMMNRATSVYPLGFVAIPLTSLSAESKGLVNPVIHCKDKLKVGKITLHDWKKNRNENLDIISAMETGCGVYFMQLALKTGLEDMQKMSKEMGFTERINPITRKIRNSDDFWKNTESKPMLAMYGIGQGVSMASPIQLNRFTSAIATGVLKDYTIIEGQPSTEKKLIGIGKITKQSLLTIRSGMQKPPNSKAAKEMKIAGLTSTTRLTPKYYGAWFTGYAPYHKPKFSVTIILQSTANKTFSGKKDAGAMATEMFKLLLPKP